uniref:histone H3-like isoform X2 n=1 Tax=Myxine glutinosa TaxID=7769 RepID=UPI00358F4715
MVRNKNMPAIRNQPKKVVGGKKPETKSPKRGPSTQVIKKRFRPGARALQEIRQFQKSTDLLIRKAPFCRLVREITMDYALDEMRWQVAALMALQEDSCTHGGCGTRQGFCKESNLFAERLRVGHPFGQGCPFKKPIFQD